MPTRIKTGISVQATSIRVLCVVLEGTGLALALNFTTTMISSARTNSVMAVISTNRKLWNQVMLSITGEPDSCRVHLAPRHLHAARAPLIEPQSIPPDGGKCCTIRPPDKRPRDVLVGVPWPDR